MKKSCFMRKELGFWGKLAGLTVFAFMVSVYGCATYQGQLDTSVPMNEQVTLTILGPLQLIEIDDNDVSASFLGIPPAFFAVIKLPAGEHTLNFSYRAMTKQGNEQYTTTTVYSADDLIVTSTFELGKKYTAYWNGTNFSGKVAIMDTEKSSSSVAVAYESGVLMGLGMDLVNTVGLSMSLQPADFIFDLGKIAIGVDTDVAMNVGWNRSSSNPFPIGLSLSGGGMVDLYFNRNNGKAFGFGVGGGFIGDVMNFVDDNAPSGVPYLRAVIIPSRRYRVKIFFDYYLKDAVEVKQPQNSYSDFDIDNWNNWGIGASIKLY
ncbi:hypothetical protein FACS189450_08330 [Spirochaetia bacterium]|nr:hypothetical protein FACS189450_08330 [Spirochaetia bacterium]